jgi:hypothetical protein
VISARVFSALAGAINKPTPTPTPTPISKAPTLPTRDSSLPRRASVARPRRFRRSLVPLPCFVLYVVRQLFTKVIKQMESGSELAKALTGWKSSRTYTLAANRLSWAKSGEEVESGYRSHVTFNCSEGVGWVVGCHSDGVISLARTNVKCRIRPVINHARSHIVRLAPCALKTAALSPSVGIRALDSRPRSGGADCNLRVFRHFHLFNFIQLEN